MQMALKAIKNCCQGTLHPVGESGTDKDIDEKNDLEN